MPLIDASAVVCRDERIIMRQSQEGWALVDPYRRTIISLNPSGRLIWELLDGAHTLGQILCRLTGEFEIDERTAAQDLQSFLNELARREMIVR